MPHKESFHCYEMNLYCTLFISSAPFVEFSIHFQSNILIYDKGYSTTSIKL